MIIKDRKFRGKDLFFTSDHHFGHDNIIKFCERPFTPENMTEELIKRWNAVVPKDGIVFNLGDFFFKCSVKEAKEIYSKLNGEIFWVKGNHDHSKVIKGLGYAELIEDRLEITVEDEEVSHGFQYIVLDHYAMMTWNHSHRGSWHLFGHTHGTLTHPSPCAFDVGIDSPDIMQAYCPISYETVKEIITRKTLGK